jgi:hypothetical protein
MRTRTYLESLAGASIQEEKDRVNFSLSFWWALLSMGCRQSPSDRAVADTTPCSDVPVDGHGFFSGAAIILERGDSLLREMWDARHCGFVFRSGDGNPSD